MMRTDPTAHALYPAGLEEPDCPACATGWHSRCCRPDLAEDGDGELVERCCDGLLIARRRRPPVDPLMLATLIGLVMLLAMAGGIVTLAGCLLAPRLPAHYARRHPQRAAAHQRERYERRMAAEWPLLAQTLGLGYRDEWTRQHRFPQPSSSLTTRA